MTNTEAHTPDTDPREVGAHLMAGVAFTMEPARECVGLAGNGAVWDGELRNDRTLSEILASAGKSVASTGGRRRKA